MAQPKFNLNDPFERTVFNRLRKILKTNIPHDAVMEAIAADFPFLEERLKESCEQFVFEFFNMSDKGILKPVIKRLTVAHKHDIAEMPFNAHQNEQFLLCGHDDVHLGLRLENPFYMLSGVKGSYSVHIDNVEINRFEREMSADERTQDLYIPLNLIKNGLVENGDVCKSLTVKVNDEYTPEHFNRCNFEVGYLDKMASEMFIPYHIGLHKQGSPEFQTAFVEKDLKSLYLTVEMDRPSECCRIESIQANVLVTDKNVEGNEADMITSLYLFKTDCGTMRADRKLFYCTSDAEGYDAPTYLFRPGKYDVTLLMWNDVIWTEEITIVADESELPQEEEKEEDNSDIPESVSSLIEEFGLMQGIQADVEFIMLDDRGKEIDGSEKPQRVLLCDRVPEKFRLNIRFDEDYLPLHDIEASIHPDKQWESEERQTISRHDIADTKTFTLDFDSFITGKGTQEIFVILEEKDGKSVRGWRYLTLGFESPEEYLDIKAFKLYNINHDINEFSLFDDISDRHPQTAFAQEQMKALGALCSFRNIRGIDFTENHPMMKWMVYDCYGRIAGARDAGFEAEDDRLTAYACIELEAGHKWEKGDYRIELQWGRQSMLCATFRIGDIGITSDYDPEIIKKRPDIYKGEEDGTAMARLDRLAGLEKVKEKVHSLVNFHRLQQQRKAAGLPTKTPMLHARFLGNPGTGKTTVARLLGQIYKEMGLLSSGHVVIEERKNLIGKYYDSEGIAVSNALSRAKGGILFIDEAYNLYVENDDKDPGRRILEYLLTALGNEEDRDWMLLLAGYPDEMERMLNSNPGIKSRVKETFIFEDLGVDELMQIAQIYCDDNSYELSDEARKRLRALISHEHENRDRHFGNGRYVNRLMEGIISTNMATRLSTVDSPTYDQLVTIEAEDISATDDSPARILNGGFDEETIDKALQRLDSLVGLGKVKSAIHNFVNVSRYLNSKGEKFTGKGLLKWNFTGNTGTGKSTVAEILADILKAMNLIRNSEVTEVKGEEIFNVTDYECNEVLKDAVRKTRKGMLLIDGDAPEFRSSEYRLTREQVRFKLASLASEDKATGALVISECSSPKLSLAHSLASNGIYDYDHTFIFDDYTEEELYEILVQCLNKYDVTMSAAAETTIREFISNLCGNRELSLANARTMKNLSRAIYEKVLVRLSSTPDGHGVREVLGCDVESFVWNQGRSRIGFLPRASREIGLKI